MNFCIPVFFRVLLSENFTSLQFFGLAVYRGMFSIRCLDITYVLLLLQHRPANLCITSQSRHNNWFLIKNAKWIISPELAMNNIWSHHNSVFCPLLKRKLPYDYTLYTLLSKDACWFSLVREHYMTYMLSLDRSDFCCCEFVCKLLHF